MTLSTVQLIEDFQDRLCLPFLAVDTETTGVDLRHGCKPYMVTTCDGDGKLRDWVFRVNPFTREPIVSEDDVLAIQEYLKDKLLIFQNPKFDVLALSLIGVQVDWNFVEDVMTASHVLDSQGSHGLKDLAARFLLISRDDQKEMEEACQLARKLAKKLKWDTARKDHPHFPAFSPTTKKPLWYADTWIPAELFHLLRGVRPQTAADAKKDRRRNVTSDPRSTDEDTLWLLSTTALGLEITTPDDPYRVDGRSLSREDLPISADQIPDNFLDVSHQYGRQDAVRTMRLWKLFLKGLMKEGTDDPRNPSKLAKDWGLLPKYLERRSCLEPLFRLEAEGMTLSEKRLDQKLSDYEQQSLRLTTSLQETAGLPDLNPGSSQQLIPILYGEDSLLKQKPTKYTEKGNQPSTDKGEIVGIYNRYAPTLTSNLRERQFAENSIQYQFCRDLLCYRKFEKAGSLLDSYRKHSHKTHIPGHFRIHTSILLPGTDTTRTSSFDPNLQNVSKDDDRTLPEDLVEYIYQTLGLSVRPVFGPLTEEIWYAADWSSLQLRLFAYASEEHRLIHAFEQGWDPHDYMAHRIFGLTQDQKPTAGQRTIAKNVNFGFIFGATEKKIDATAMRPGLYEELRQMFPNAVSFMEATITQVKKHGYVYTPGGYRLGVTDHHAGVNYIIQGAEGEIAQLALRKCSEYCYSSSFHPVRPIMLIHDELIFRAYGRDPKQHRPHVRNLVGLMEDAGQEYGGYHLPVDCEYITETWNKKRDYPVTLSP